ncbi:right-handed parallel beta-helix repeat-containing protein [Rhodopseudomonas palustris]|uniref:right-handed parallel beta-helix repeat-containing protein n=1 Tax=Rhodopseudomonas palustris TaxID=1076 RepID=UPI00115CA50D|nr:right-handed parallel beta-helix repeat-containing protein [Rhodopseudomonas palustris]QDL97006.1 right-handed parallel beta-helix repeat-containing protein [Rhodopseudomonas palustris]
MISIIVDYGTYALSGIGAIALIFATPAGKTLVERWFSRRPVFSTESPTFDSRLIVVVEATNRRAKRNKPLGVRIRGLNITNASKIDTTKEQLTWVVDLSRIDHINDVLIEGNDYDFQFFFDPEHPSEKITLKYVGSRNATQSKPAANLIETRRSTTWRSATELVGNLTSNLNAKLQSDAPMIISRAFPVSGPHAEWQNVHDGKELLIRNAERLDICDGTILAEPRYAWILHFVDCREIALRNLVMGHTSAGYCMGGVVRFENCANIILESCDFFGCGTYGIELENCENIEIVDTVIRECTYGGANLTDIIGVTFRNCTFIRNEGFDLINLEGNIADTTFQSCNFESNSGSGKLFKFEGRESRYGLFINDCTFKKNAYKALISPPHTIDTNFNSFK